jgi:hypothetical protein
MKIDDVTYLRPGGHFETLISFIVFTRRRVRRKKRRGRD